MRACEYELEQVDLFKNINKKYLILFRKDERKSEIVLKIIFYSNEPHIFCVVHFH